MMKQGHSNRESNKIHLLSDLIEWSVYSGNVSELPVWVYLFQSLWVEKRPIQCSCSFDQDGSQAIVSEWVQTIKTRDLLTWSLGIRAQQVVRGKAFYVPPVVAKLALEELLRRPHKEKNIRWIKRKFVLLVE